MEANMNSNLKAGSAFKDLLLRKLSYAVTCSVLSYVLVVFIYIFLINFNVQFSDWFKCTYDTLTSFSTWLYLIPFCSIIFAQIMICAKDYVLKSTYQLSRFKKIIAIFSMRTFIIGLLHVVVGGLVIWLYLSVGGGPYQALFVKCEEENYCLVEGTFYLTLSGLWTGLYFFLRIYTSDKNIVFPVVQQRKILHFKAKFLPLLKESKRIAFYPTIYYFILYYIFGSYLRNSIVHIFKLKLQQNEDFGLWLYFHTWVFSVLYVLNMNLMRFFFELYLTEPVEHPVMAMYENDASLPEALLLNNIPILQHLACLDLYLLSLWSPQRRQTLFTLSQPGGHPHTWNCLIQGAVKLMTEFTDIINRSADTLLGKEEKVVPVNKYQILLGKTEVQSPIQKPPKFPTMRNMSLPQPVDSIDIVHITQSTRNTDFSEISEAVGISIVNKIKGVIEKIKNIRMIKYIFGELPETHIQQCLKNGQLIVWITQGLANLAVASFTEDPYGIVQKDLPLLLTSLVQLKQSVDKLNKVPMFSKKGQNFDDFSFKMKNSVQSAIKRSLFSICRTFGTYLNDIPLQKDVIAQLQCYL